MVNLKCHFCNTEIQVESVAIVERHGWFVYKDGTTCKCFGCVIAGLHEEEERHWQRVRQENQRKDK